MRSSDVFWSWYREPALGQADAGAVENEGRGGRAALTIGGGFAHKCGLWGQAKVYEHTYAYLKKRTRWLCSQAYRREHLPIGSGITEAAYKIVFTQRLKRSGMSWTERVASHLHLRVLWLRGV